MRFRLGREAHEFAATLRQMLDRHFTTTDLRRVWDNGDGEDPELWRRLADLGVLAIMVPAQDGGLGGTLLDAVLLFEELGRVAAPGPVVESIAVAATALAGGEWAPQLATGAVTVTAALMDEPLVPHRTADLALVSAGERIALVPTDRLGLTPAGGVDGGRLLGARAGEPPHGVLIDRDLRELLDVGASASAAFLLGLSSRMIELTANYARDRHQFGKPIGAFQAVKHHLADALLAVEFARPAVYRAAWSYATAQTTRARDVSMAKCLASEAARKAARIALQVHGAIGYAWECDLHLFMKKSWALSSAWGGPQHHRRIVGDAVLAGATTRQGDLP